MTRATFPSTLVLLAFSLGGCTMPVTLPTLGQANEPPAVSAPPPTAPAPAGVVGVPPVAPRAGQGLVVAPTGPRSPTVTPVGASPPVTTAATPPVPAVPPASAPPALGALGVRGPTPAEAAPPAFIPMTPSNVAGEWTALDEGASAQCRLLLAAPTRGGLSAARPEGCASGDLARVAGWQSRGADLMLVDGRGAPIILMRPAGPNRYEGNGLSRERYAIWR